MKEKVAGFCTLVAMKKLFALILFVLNLLLSQAQEVKIVSVNGALQNTRLPDSISISEEIHVKNLYKHFVPDSIRPDTLTTPYKWMLKLVKKLTCKQRKDNNIYIFFVPRPDSVTGGFLPITGKYGYVFVDTTKKNAYSLENQLKKAFTHKYQWDAIHDPGWSLFGNLFQDESEGASMAQPTVRCLTSIDAQKLKSSVFYSVDGNPIDIKGGIPYAFISQNETDTKIRGALAFFYDETGKLFTYYHLNGIFKCYAPVGVDITETNYESLRYKTGQVNATPQYVSVSNDCKFIVNPGKADTYTVEAKTCDCQDISKKVIINQSIYLANYNALKSKLSDAKDDESLKALCNDIATIDPNILKAYNNWATETNNQNNNFFIWYYPENDKLSKDDLTALKATISKFKDSYTKFINAQLSDAASIVKHVNENFTSKGSMFNYCIVHPFQNVTLENRKKLLTTLASAQSLGQRGRVSGDYEELDIIQDLLVNTTKTDAWECIKDLESKNQLFKILEQATDLMYFGQGKFSSFTELIGKLAIEKDNIASDGSKVGEVLFAQNRGLFFDDTYLGNLNKEVYNKNNSRVEFNVKNGPVENFVKSSSTTLGGAATGAIVNWMFNPGNENAWEGKVSCKPLEHIAIIPISDITYKGQTLNAGQIYVLPAVTVYAMFKEDTKSAIGISAKIAFDIGLTAVGVGALNAAFKTCNTITLLAEATDITLGVGASVINRIPEVEKNHPEFVKYYNYAVITYGLARLGFATYKPVKPYVAKSVNSLVSKTLETFGKTTISKLPNAFIDNIETIVKNNGWTMETFKSLINKRIIDLTPEQISTITKIREALPGIEANTVCQKVLTNVDADKYMENVFGTTVQGSVSRAQDTKHLQTVSDLFDGLRLDYSASSPFKRTDDFVYVLRFKSGTPANARISNTTDIMGQYSYPYTGNGFTAGTTGANGKMGVPEFYIDKTSKMDMTEAAILKVKADGTEEVVSVLDEKTMKFIKIE